MAMVRTPYDMLDPDIYLDLRPTIGINLYLKCEGLNFAGSIKLRTAASMVAAAERSGLLRADSVLIESSSGNMGVALAMIAASRGLDFVCVTDDRCNPAIVRTIRALGATAVILGPVGGESLLARRKCYVRDRCQEDSRYVWLNQYENPENPAAHYEITGPAIARRFPGIDVLFVGVGTGGTLAGCTRYFRERPARVRIVPVDTVGSVNLSGTAGERRIPGIGAAEFMPFANDSGFQEVVRVVERETVRACRELARHGFLLGGSSGTVIAGAAAWLRDHDPDQRLTAVAIAPDMGDRYLDTIYDDDWVQRSFAEDHPSARASPPVTIERLPANAETGERQV